MVLSNLKTSTELGKIIKWRL